MSEHARPLPSPGDRTTRARIRDEALRLFGSLGFQRATVRAIAAAADVSPALVLHHYGSKNGLRAAVDEHVAGVIREGKLMAMTGAWTTSAAEYEALSRTYEPYMNYLARSLTEDDDAAQHMYGLLFADAVEYLAAGERAGIIRSGRDPEARAAVLLNVSLAGLLLGRQAARVLGADDKTELQMRMAGPVLDLYIDGLFTDDRFRRMLDGLWDQEDADAEG